MVQRSVRGFRVFVPVVVVLGLLTTIWTPMPSAFAAAPTVTSFSPTSGGTGTRIVITGTNFTGSGNCVVDRVQFGGTTAASYVVNSPTQITAIVGTGKTGLINVRTAGTGCGNKNSVATFTYSATTYTVTYNGNSNTGGMVPVDGTTPYASGGTVTVLGNTGMLVKTGYVFTNWNTAANGSGTSYSTGNTFAISANTILYAQWTITYTVTYSGNGDTGGSGVPVDGSSPYANGATVTVLGNTGSLVRTGSTFANWNTAANGSGTSYAPSATFAIGANTILYAQWRAAVIYNGNGATGGTVPVDGSSPYLNGATVTVLGDTGSLVKTGSTFTHWNTAANGSGTSYSVGNTFPIAADTVLYAQWTGITYTVTYDGNGNTGGMVPTDASSPYASGSTVTVLGNTMMLVKTGYIFANWNTAANGSGTPYAPTATFTIAANTTLYAQWTTTYTVTYNGNGRTGGAVPVDGSSPYVSGATVTILGNTGLMVRTGSTFANWNTAADGSGTTYAPDATFTVNSNTILYAVWRAAVIYNGNGSTGGTVPVDGSSPYLTGATATVFGNTGSLVKTGSSFVGWNTAASGSGTTYVAGNSFAVTADTVLYAQWSATTYTVTYNGNTNTSGMVPLDGSSPYASGSTVAVLGNTGSLVKTGYIFANWNTAANGSGTSYAPGNTFTIGADTILYAQWAATYTITYNDNGATSGTVPVDGSSPYASGATVAVLTNSGVLVKAGNTFANWNTAANGSGTSYAPGNTFTIGADTVLYAQWAPIGTYTVAYNGDGSTGGTVPDDVSSPYAGGATVTVIGNIGSLVKTGYVFAHWNTAANGSRTSYSASDTFAIGADTILYAQWTVSVTYNANGATSGTVPVDESSPYVEGATVTVKSNSGVLAKVGSSFTHWNTAANGSGTSYSPAATFTIGVNTVLYAQWTAIYTVTYRTGFSTGGTVPVDASSPYVSSATVTVLENTGSLVRPGTTFDGWNTLIDGSGTSYVDGNTFTITADTLLFAQWRATLTYNANGAAGGTVPVDGSSPYLSPYQTPPTVTVLGNTGSLVRAGYTFAHWCTSPDNSGQHYMADETFVLAANTVLYAQWTATVIYNANGATSGTVPVDGSSPYLKGVAVTVLTNSGSLFKTGYIFANWNTAADGLGTSYSPGNTFAMGVSTILYAQWTATYTVAYSGHGETGGSSPIDASSPYTSGATVIVSGNIGSLVKTGSVFSHWNTAADGSGTSYSPGKTFTIGANTVLYAQWRATVTYNGNGSTGGTVPVDGSSPYLDGGTVTVLGNTGVLARTGYTFDHWCTTPDNSGQHYMPSDTFAIAADTVLYAQWAAIGSYLVSYNDNGSTSGTAPVDASSPYLSGSTVTVLGNTGSLANTGSTFANWNTEPDGSGTSYAPSATFTIGASIFLYAQWAPVGRYIVAYNGNGSTGGTVPVDGSSPYLNGATVTVLGNSGSLAKSGNTFANWNTASNGSGTAYAPADAFAIGADVVLYAQWAPVGTYTVGYNGNGSTGGTVPVDGSSPYANGATVTVLGNSGSLAKTGYTFANWNTTANGSGTSYSTGNTFAIGAETILYAQWSVVTPPVPPVTSLPPIATIASLFASITAQISALSALVKKILASGSSRSPSLPATGR